MLPDINPAADPDVKELTAQSAQLLALSSTYKVATADQYNGAGDELKRVKAAQKRLDDLRKSMTRPLDAAKKAIMDFFRAPEDQLARAESGIKRAMIAFSEEQERIRREEQRKAEEAARKERERLEAQARKAAESGKAEKAEQLEERAAAVVAPVIQREPPKVAGVSVRKVWKFEITDPSKINPTFLMPDETKIRKQVLALGADAASIVGPGVRIYQENQYASGAA